MEKAWAVADAEAERGRHMGVVCGSSGYREANELQQEEQKGYGNNFKHVNCSNRQRIQIYIFSNRKEGS